MKIRITRHCCSLLFLVMTAQLVGGIAKGTESDEESASTAYQEYWEGFDEYEKVTSSKSRQELETRWDSIKSAYQSKKKALTTAQSEALEQASREYISQLNSSPNETERPHVMLNLAMIKRLLAELRASSGNLNNAGFLRQEAVELLTELTRMFPGFVDREKALYLKATILGSEGRQEESMSVWKELAGSAKGIHGAHALIAIGDAAFRVDNTREAESQYRRALALVRSLDEIGDKDFQVLRTEYRLAWASFRSGNFEESLASARSILLPNRNGADRAATEKIRRDATDLAASALYEINNAGFLKKYLSDRQIQPFAAGIAYSVAVKYAGSSIHTSAISAGDLAITQWPSAIEYPKVLALVASEYKELRKTRQHIVTLEKLANLLPASSLWRARNTAHPEAIQEMEGGAESAAELVATHYYEVGLASGSSAAFASAETYYTILIGNGPNALKSNRWRLRIGHCQYFAENLPKAEKTYRALVEERSISADILEVASYHLVLTYEKMWRKATNAAITRGEEPKNDRDVKKALEHMSLSANSFADKFPEQSRSIDLVLVVAGALRDTDRITEAALQWQRALVSRPQPGQRAIAIRGLVYTAIRTGSSADVVVTTERFLQLEDWRVMGSELAQELKGVLSSSVIDEGNRLARSGKNEDGGTLMTRVGNEFHDIPNREKILRDGAYMLAVAGAWGSAQQASQKFLDEGLTRHADDMMYLRARSLEYQLKFRDAAQAYYDLAQRYPGYDKTRSSLERGERLAAAENDNLLGGKQAEMRGDGAKDEATKLSAYALAVEQYLTANQTDAAMKVARKRAAASKTEDQKLRSQLMIAKIGLDSRKDSRGVAAVGAIAQRADSKRDDDGDDAFRTVGAEAHYLLGMEEMKRFRDFDIFERSGGVVANVNEKSKIFEKLSSHFTTAAARAVPRFSTESRYRLAEAAEEFANEIAAIPSRSGETLAQKAQLRFSETSRRLRNISQTNLTTNVLARSKDPARYHGDEWVQRSASKLGGTENGRGETGKDVLPASVQVETPYQWSL